MVSDKVGVQDLISLFKQKNIQKIVIAPGSRNAPLTISFTQDKYFTCYSIPDERSAAFFALGMAQYDKCPVAVICTSGSAVLNFYPAVAEAYYQKIPLVVISADRPQEWIDQADGQTIRQVGALDKHVKYSVNLLQEAQRKNDRIYNQRLINEALNQSMHGKKGPVHINFPFEEPLYGQVSEAVEPAKNISIASTHSIVSSSELENLTTIWNNSEKRMILTGVASPSNELNQILNQLSLQAVVLTETTSNVYGDHIFSCIDRLVKSLTKEEEAELQPDLLITLGGPVISKQIKFLLRKYPPKHHIHIDADDWHLDTYQCLTQSIPIEPKTVLKQLVETIDLSGSSDYFEYWNKSYQSKRNGHQAYISQMQWSDHKVFGQLHKSIPHNYHIQLANSSPVRYAQLYEWDSSLVFYCNRGTSGIDGSSSTAVGYAEASNKPTLLISGDVSFLYDSNAFWNNHVPENLRIIVINNNGGGIFRIIPGPSSTSALSNFFETHHEINGKALTETYGLDYQLVENEEDLKKVLPSFFAVNGNKGKVLEIATPRLENAAILHEYFKALKA